MEYITGAPKGAALLDEKMPGWADRINLDLLAMPIAERCILGQLYGGTWTSYTQGVDALFGDPPGNDEIHRMAVDHGFNVLDCDEEDSDDEYRALNQEWTALVLERRQES